MDDALKMMLLAGAIPRPTIELDFSRGSASSLLTYAGGANGTVFDSTGSIVAATTPRITFDGYPGGAQLGIKLEGQRTNLLLNSAIDGSNLATQDVTVSAASHTLTFYGTGSITLSGVATGTLTSAGAYPARARLTFTPTAGTLTITVNGQVRWAQLEAATSPSSFIPTAGSAVTRTADDVTMVAGTLDDYFTPGRPISMYAEMSRDSDPTAAANILHVAPIGTTTNRTTLSLAGASVVRTSVTESNVNFAVPNSGIFLRSAARFGANNVNFAYEGIVCQSDMSVTLPSTANPGIRVGGLTVTTMNGTLRKALIWVDTLLTDAQLHRLTGVLR